MDDMSPPKCSVGGNGAGIPRYLQMSEKSKDNFRLPSFPRPVHIWRPETFIPTGKMMKIPDEKWPLITFYGRLPWREAFCKFMSHGSLHRKHTCVLGPLHSEPSCFITLSNSLWLDRSNVITLYILQLEKDQFLRLKKRVFTYEE